MWLALGRRQAKKYLQSPDGIEGIQTEPRGAARSSDGLTDRRTNKWPTEDNVSKISPCNRTQVNPHAHTHGPSCGSCSGNNHNFQRNTLSHLISSD